MRLEERARRKAGDVGKGRLLDKASASPFWRGPVGSRFGAFESERLLAQCLTPCSSLLPGAVRPRYAAHWSPPRSRTVLYCRKDDILPYRL